MIGIGSVQPLPSATLPSLYFLFFSLFCWSRSRRRRQCHFVFGSLPSANAWLLRASRANRNQMRCRSVLLTLIRSMDGQRTHNRLCAGVRAKCKLASGMAKNYNIYSQQTLGSQSPPKQNDEQMCENIGINAFISPFLN